jgi:hypothetical protein
MVHEVELMAGGRGTGGKMLCQEAGVGVGQEPESVLGGPKEVDKAVLAGVRGPLPRCGLKVRLVED